MSIPASRLGTFVAALAIVLAARDGAAQGSGAAQRAFAGASVAWNIDNSVRSSSGEPRTGGSLAVGLAAGFTFADRWSLQVEAELPTADQTVSDQYTFQPGYPYGSQAFTYVTQTTYRTPTVAVLFGVHWRLPKRVDIAFQFGPCLRNERQTFEQQILVNGAVTDSYQGSRNDWLLSASVGGEVAVSVTSRVAVVGQVRVHMQSLYVEDFLLDTVVRPAVGVRVRF